ncbi:MAG: hypothetical protein K940chlam7_01867, partial [Chlamydiae bacterium]|nr:hypothetical protein [Chlamydiota bacterium]
EKLLFIWEKSYITDQDLMLVFFKEDSRRYDAVKYALKKGILKSVRRGLYLRCVSRNAEVISARALSGSLQKDLSSHQHLP